MADHGPEWHYAVAEQLIDQVTKDRDALVRDGVLPVEVIAARSAFIHATAAIAQVHATLATVQAPDKGVSQT